MLYPDLIHQLLPDNVDGAEFEIQGAGGVTLRLVLSDAMHRGNVWSANMEGSAVLRKDDMGLEEEDLVGSTFTVLACTIEQSSSDSLVLHTVTPAEPMTASEVSLEINGLEVRFHSAGKTNRTGTIVSGDVWVNYKAPISLPGIPPRLNISHHIVGATIHLKRFTLRK